MRTGQSGMATTRDNGYVYDQPLKQHNQHSALNEKDAGELRRPRTRCCCSNPIHLIIFVCFCALD